MPIWITREAMATIAKTGVAAIAQGGVAAPGGGGGAFFGDGARLIAFEKVMNRMSAPTGQRSPREIADWPTDTFFTARKNFWFGGEPIEMWHVPAAHSDSDVMVFFRKSDVIVAGDVIAADRYPYIDAKNGGSIQGIIAGLNQIVATAVPEYNQQGGTRIIPGHGRVLNQSDVVEHVTWPPSSATVSRDWRRTGRRSRRSRPCTPTLDYDGIYGSTTGPWTTDMFIEEVYKEVTSTPAR